jgi:hypothetical protein
MVALNIEMMALRYVTWCGFFSVGTSISQETVASIFRLKLPFIILVDVIVLWYVTWCGLFRRCQLFRGFCCLHLQIKITIYRTRRCHGLMVRNVVWFLPVGASVSEDFVAANFRLKLPCIVLVDVIVLWYVTWCGFFL